MNISVYELQTAENRLPYLYSVNTTQVDNRSSYRSPGKIIGLLKDVFRADKQSEEHVWLLCFDGHYHVTGLFEVSHGTVNSSLISPAQIMQRALLCGAVSIVLAHLHPSGDVEPSREDDQITRHVKESGKLLGINLVDHIIIAGAGQNAYYSYAEEQRL
jgi:DNA repair protein RadC